MCFCVVKKSYLYEFDRGSILMGAAMFSTKPGKDKQQYTLLINGLKIDFMSLLFLFCAFAA